MRGWTPTPSCWRRPACHAAELTHVGVRFVQADLSEPGWAAALGEPPPRCDLVVCLATLQHMPGYPLRAQVMRTWRG